MGWERKRGKLEEFNAALRGDARALRQRRRRRRRGCRASKYVITLDSDTQLPRDAARAAGGHAGPPAEPAALRRASAAGSPRATASCSRASASRMPSAQRSRFARLFAGDPGIDPYTRAVSDVYQDLFGEGSFVGKGIYDVDAVRAGARRAAAREPHPQPRPARGRATRARGWSATSRLFEDYPVDVRRRREPAPPLDPRRLADRAAGSRGRVPGRRAAGRSRTRISALSRGRSSTTCGAAWCRSRCCALLARRLGDRRRGAARDAGRASALLRAARRCSRRGAALAAPPERAAARARTCATSRRTLARQLAARGVRARLPAVRRLHRLRRDRCAPRARAVHRAPAARVADRERRAAQRAHRPRRHLSGRCGSRRCAALAALRPLARRRRGALAVAAPVLVALAARAAPSPGG